jgi:hypothetical protein
MLAPPARKDSPMPRRHRDQSFRKSDVVRAYKAAKAAGIPNPRIVIDTDTKQIIISSGAPGDDDPMRARDASTVAKDRIDKLRTL